MSVRRFAIAGASAALLAAFSLAPTIARAASPLLPTSALATSAVAGLSALVARDSVDLGSAGPAAARVVLGLPLRDQVGLQALLRSQSTPGSPNYHRFLTPGEFAGRFGPEQATVDAVMAWAAKAGLSVSAVSPNRTLVTIEGSAGAVGSAFATTLHRFRSAGGVTYLAPDRLASLPASLAGRVDTVVGLSGFSRTTVAPRRAATSAQASFPPSYGPQDLWAAYNAPAAQTGGGQTIAVLAEGDVGHGPSRVGVAGL